MLDPNKKVRKGAFILIIILLLIFLPLSCYGVYLKATGYDKPKALENTAKALKFDGKLWFYSSLGELLYTYECEFPNDFCGYTNDYNLDQQYNIQSITNDTPVEIPLINDRYAFITDTSDATYQPVFMIDTVSKISYKLAPYQHIKNYGVGLENNMIIVQNLDNLYGVMQLLDTPKFITQMKYNYIGVQNELTSDNLLKSDKFIVNFNGYWYLINTQDEFITEKTTDIIVAYSNDAIITKDNNNSYHFLNYDGTNKLDEENYSFINFVGKYIALTTSSEYYIYDYINMVDISERYPIEGDTVYSAKKTTTGIQIYRNEVPIDEIKDNTSN